MALVGDMFREDPRAAFAHLKLTSGVATFIGFFWLPTLSLRTAALVTLGFNVCGAAGFGALLATGATRAAPDVDGGAGGEVAWLNDRSRSDHTNHAEGTELEDASTTSTRAPPLVVSNGATVANDKQATHTAADSSTAAGAGAKQDFERQFERVEVL